MHINALLRPHAPPLSPSHCRRARERAERAARAAAYEEADWVRASEAAGEVRGGAVWHMYAVTRCRCLHIDGPECEWCWP